MLLFAFHVTNRITLVIQFISSYLHLNLGPQSTLKVLL